MGLQQDHLKTEKEFINLLLRFKNLVGDWVESNLRIEHLDSSFHKILQAIVDAFSQDVLLTRRSYLDYLEKYNHSKQQIIAEELLFNRIFMLQTPLDDYPMLRSKILDSYLLRSAIDFLREFNPNKDKKGNLFAVTQLAEQLQSLLDSYSRDHSIVFEDVVDFAPEFYQYVLDVKSGKIKQDEIITCGINEIDYSMTIGFAPGTLTLLCSDTGGYKSTLMLNIGANVWKNQKKNVLFIPLEMPKKEMFQKLVSRESEVPFDKLYNPLTLKDDDVKKIKDKMDKWGTWPHRFFIMDSEDRTKVSVIRREIEKHLEVFKPDLVVIDYIANLVPDFHRKDRNDLEIGDMLKDLRHMGKKLGFGVVSGAQIGREALKRFRKQSGDKIIAYSEDVRGSHEYSADADFIFALMPDPQQPAALVHLIVMKSRYGKKVFKDGRPKAALEVRPEISLIKSREDILLNVDAEDVLQKTQDDTLNFENDVDDTDSFGTDDIF